MRRRGLVIVLATGVSVLALAGSALAAAPPGTIDQKHECAATTCNFPGGAQYPHWNNTIETMDGLGQTFTAGVTGQLTGVEIYVDRLDSAAPASLTVQIEATTSGLPNGSVLASVTVPTAGMPAPNPGWVSATLASPIDITSGTKYAIVLQPIATGSPWLAWQVDCSDSGCSGYAYTDYAGGEAYASVGGTWEGLLGILTDGGTGTADLAFRTYVQVPASPSPASPSPAVPSPVLTPPTTSTVVPGDPPRSDSIPLIVLLLTIVGVVLLASRLRTSTRGR